MVGGGGIVTVVVVRFFMLNIITVKRWELHGFFPRGRCAIEERSISIDILETCYIQQAHVMMTYGPFEP